MRSNGLHVQTRRAGQGRRRWATAAVERVVALICAPLTLAVWLLLYRWGPDPP